MQSYTNVPRRDVNLGLGGGRLIQIAGRTPIQMMSYMVETPGGGLIMIDGGNYQEPEAMNLYEMIRERGSRVDLWFITHAHNDHFGAVSYLMDKLSPFDIEIGAFVFNFPTDEWLSGKRDSEGTKRFLEGVKRQGIRVMTPEVGDIIECGGLTVQILHTPREYEGYSSMNPTSIIFKLHFPERDVLILGDFDREGEEEYLSLGDRGALRCEIVQMAHHGQDGISKEFYSLIMPKICLYPTPLWLWENNKYACDDPETRGTGPFETLETRAWMEELGVEASYRQFDGDLYFS